MEERINNLVSENLKIDDNSGNNDRYYKKNYNQQGDDNTDNKGVKEEDTTANKDKENTDYFNKDKKKFKEEVKPEELLERPKDAISLADYKKQIAEKNQSLKQEQKRVENKVDNSLLKQQERNRDDEEWQNSRKKKGGKVKRKNVDEVEERINKLVSENLKIDDNSGNNDRDRKTYQNYQKDREGTYGNRDSNYKPRENNSNTNYNDNYGERNTRNYQDNRERNYNSNYNRNDNSKKQGVN